MWLQMLSLKPYIVGKGDVLCIMGDAFVVHVQDMQITKTDVIDALLSIDDGLTQTWIVDWCFFHVWSVVPHLM